MDENWSYGVVAFVDILGFSALVSSDSRSIRPKHLENLRSLLGKVSEAFPNLDLRAFSDSITIAAPLTSANVQALVESVTSLQQMLVQGGVLVRGAIALGKHFADEILVYSEALIRAYLLENDKAKFPRILLDQDLLDWYFHSSDTSVDGVESVRRMLLMDRDNQVFLNYLVPENLRAHLTVVERCNVGNLSSSVLEKIQWLGQYHNFIAEGLGGEHVLGGDALGGFREVVVSP
ncbi:hypothetical protein [Pandoraea oxalativorans]|uniref:Guanylate cyclase domain-containing protein n=1 Tax=Pandoraea oxalativorans TaxID=573737 RepID=A0A192B1J0_9BURK|nr:hypothetical protein [Pandoraea oxalativorans]ANJ87170.1 hypothetical protein MB84_31185 [Pandoraea oxalativorans]